MRNRVSYIRSTATQIRRILLFFGGIDLSDETSKSLDALELVGASELSVDVILGANNLCRRKIQNRLAGRRNYRCLVQVDNMAEFMATAQLSIGAGGTASWERLAMGLPAIVMSVAPNQTQGCTHLSRTRHHFYLGESSSVSVKDLKFAIEERLRAPAETLACGIRGMKFVDGLGCTRIAKALSN